MRTALRLVTCEQHPALPPDDQLLLEPLREAGFEPQVVRWDDPHHVWNADVPVVLRSPWDYHLRMTEFSAWLDTLESRGTRVFNPVSVVRWNTDKHYLADLAKGGVPVVETELVEPNSPRSLTAILAQHGWNEAVVKPCVSAGSHQTVRFHVGEAEKAEATLRGILARGLSAMVQPFLEEVQRDGEWSLFFFNRRFSHAVVKRPAPGDFRVQEEFGGQSNRVQVPPQFLRTAEHALAQIPEPLLYARVDAIPVRGNLRIGEVELIEPSLFLQQAPEAPARFAAALRELLRA